MLVQTMEGLAVALSLAMLVTTHSEMAARMSALQAVMVGVIVALHAAILALIPLALAAAILLLGRLSPTREDAVRPAAMLAGSALALLALTFPGGHLALAVVVLGAAMTATRRSAAMQIVGLVSLQNGIILAAATTPVATAGAAIAMVPIVPAVAAAGLWLRATRQGASALAAWPTNTWFDAIACSAALVCSAVLPWLAPLSWNAMQLDRFTAAMVPLLAVVATAAAWARRLDAGGTPSPAGGRLVLLVSAALAILLDDPVASWLALVIATIAAAALCLPRRAEAWRRLRLGGLGLGVALSGMIATGDTPPGAQMWPPVCALVGLGILACLAPELALATVAVIVRCLHLLAGHASLETLLMAAGLAAIAIAGCAARDRDGHLPLVCVAGLGQTGITLFAFGLDMPEAQIAAVINLVLLGLTQAGLLLAAEGSPAEAAATAGLAGVPPFGGFPALALVIAATATRTPWMLLPFGAALGLFVCSVLMRLRGRTRTRSRPRRRPYAWAPLALALLVGFALPQTAVAWLQAAASGATAAAMQAGGAP